MPRMRVCDTCGGPIADDQPFAVCARCLFAEALEAEESSEADAPPTPPGLGRFPRSLFRISSRGEFFEKYEVQERLWHGGQGEILKVWDSHLRRPVAMKRLADAFLGSEAA